jgi:hypothetical protein
VRADFGDNRVNSRSGINWSTSVALRGTGSCLRLSLLLLLLLLLLPLLLLLLAVVVVSCVRDTTRIWPRLVDSSAGYRDWASEGDGGFLGAIGGVGRAASRFASVARTEDGVAVLGVAKRARVRSEERTLHDD